jgi:drug/metabolite transporter (DMT)-like permease
VKDSFMVNLLAILCCFLWSTAFVGIKIGLEFASPLYFAGIRFMIAGILLIPFWWKNRPDFKTFWENLPKVVLISFFQTFLLYSLFYMGLARTSGAITAIVVGSSPLWAAILSHFFMEADQLNWKRFFSLLLGVLGVALIVWGKTKQSLAGNTSLLGVLMVLASCGASGIGNILVAKYKAKLNPVFQNSLQIFLGGLGLYLGSLAVEPGYIHSSNTVPIKFILSLIWLSSISAVAFSLWFYLLQREEVKVSDLNLWKFIIPVSGAVLSWSLLPDEKPTVYAVAGMICIAISILLFNFLSNKLKKMKVAACKAS